MEMYQRQSNSGIAAIKPGGYWTLTAGNDEILRLKDSDEVKEVLEPAQCSVQQPSSRHRSENVEAEAPKAEAIWQEVPAEDPPAYK